MSDSVWPHRRQPTRLCHPWDSPGKNTGVGCHFLLQCMKVKGESEVAQSCLTLRDPMVCSLPGSSIHGILQARTLEWVDISFSNAWKWKVKVKSLNRVRLFRDPRDCSLPGSSVHGIFQARVLDGLPLPSPQYQMREAFWFYSKKKKKTRYGCTINVWNIIVCIFGFCL